MQESEGKNEKTFIPEIAKVEADLIPPHPCRLMTGQYQQFPFLLPHNNVEFSKCIAFLKIETERSVTLLTKMYRLCTPLVPMLNYQQYRLTADVRKSGSQGL
jgi:hypothetical protein